MGQDNQAPAPGGASPAPALSPHVHPAPSIGPVIYAGDVPAARTPVSEGRYHGEQGMYLAASGTLTQVNAILAALLIAALPSAHTLATKIVVGLAVAGHAIAGSLLCWAARPVANADGTPRVTAADMLQRAFTSYRRGWLATMLALVLSLLALALLAWQQIGADLLALLP